VDLMRDTGGIIEQINPFKLAALEMKVNPAGAAIAASASPEAVPTVAPGLTVASPPPDDQSKVRPKSRAKKK